MPTGPDVLRAWFGANAIGATLLAADSRGARLVPRAHAEPRRVEGARRAQPARSSGSSASTCRTSSSWSLVGGERGRRAPWRTTPLDEILDGASDERPTPTQPVEPWDDLSLIYTSGTTGPSKGVRASHAAFWNYARCFILPYVGEEDRYLNSLPMFYTAGTGITYSMLLAGGSVALNKGFNPRTFWDDVPRFEATITIAIHGMVIVPARPAAVAGRPRPHAEDGLHGAARRATRSSPSASASTSTPRSEWPRCRCRSSRISTRRTSAAAAARPDPVDYELRLVDEHDVPVAVGTPGELVVRHACRG